MAQQKALAVECTAKGSHSDDEREKIMAAINYALTNYNKGETNEGIRDRLQAKGFSKMLIVKWEHFTFSWTYSSSKCSRWKVNGTEYYIYTDLVLE